MGIGYPCRSRSQNIGKTPDDFKKLAEKKGLLKPDTKAGEIVAWLKKDFELGHGHAMAIYTVFKGLKEPKQDKDAAIGKHFTADKKEWRPVYDKLCKVVMKLGDDTSIDPAISYISFLKGGKKFAIVKIVADRIDVGIKLKTEIQNSRLEIAGSWNNLVTHRVRIKKPGDIDKELESWLKQAYISSGNKG